MAISLRSFHDQYFHLDYDFIPYVERKYVGVEIMAFVMTLWLSIFGIIIVIVTVFQLCLA